MDCESSYGLSDIFTYILHFFLKLMLGTIGVAVRALELILWGFEATPDAIIFRLVGGTKDLKIYL